MVGSCRSRGGVGVGGVVGGIVGGGDSGGEEAQWLLRLSVGMGMGVGVGVLAGGKMAADAAQVTEVTLKAATAAAVVRAA